MGQTVPNVAKPWVIPHGCRTSVGCWPVVDRYNVVYFLLLWYFMAILYQTVGYPCVLLMDIDGSVGRSPWCTVGTVVDMVKYGQTVIIISWSSLGVTQI